MNIAAEGFLLVFSGEYHVIFAFIRIFFIKAFQEPAGYGRNYFFMQVGEGDIAAESFFICGPAAQIIRSDHLNDDRGKRRVFFVPDHREAAIL